MKTKNIALKALVALSYLAMVGVNYLANALPIGGVTTGEASDSYSNLFTPAGITFSIWGIIYLFLFGYTLYQFGLFQKKANPNREELFTKIGPLFIATSLANIAWVISWHYGLILLSTIIMLALLVLLIIIASFINAKKFSFKSTLLIKVPFSIYFGWITVAAIANIIVLLVSLSWDGFGVSEATWTVIILLIGAVIGIVRMLKDKNVFYGLVLVWAYGGILIKHVSENGFGGQYTSIITTVAICLALYVSTIIYLLYKNRQK